MILTQQFESSSSSAKYTTQYDTSTGKGTCNCPGWTRRAVRECKHTKLLAADDRAGGAAGIVAKKVEPLKVSGPGVKPMLASAMKEDQGLLDFMTDEWVMEEKFDGHRLLVIVDGQDVQAWTRPGHDRPAALRMLPQHLIERLVKLPDGIYDGELLIEGGTSSDVVRLDLQDKLVLVIFDILEVNHKITTSLPLEQRVELLAAATLDYFGVVRRPFQWNVSVETVKKIWDQGGEGAVIKRKSSVYRSGWRTPDWIKVKEIGAAEFTIIGFGDGKNGPQSTFLLRHDDGRETSCKILTNELLAAVKKSPKKYLGRRIVISHMGFTKSGLWRHPVFDHFVQED